MTQQREASAMNPERGERWVLRPLVGRASAGRGLGHRADPVGARDPCDRHIRGARTPLAFAGGAPRGVFQNFFCNVFGVPLDR